MDHDLEHWLRAREQLSKGRSSGNKSQKDARPENTPTNNDIEEKVLSARHPRGRGEERHAQAPTSKSIVYDLDQAGYRAIQQHNSLIAGKNVL